MISNARANFYSHVEKNIDRACVYEPVPPPELEIPI